MLRVTQTILWVRLERDTFDLAGILISTLQMAVIGIALSLFLGGIWGALVIARRRREGDWHPTGHLGLDTHGVR